MKNILNKLQNFKNNNITTRFNKLNSIKKERKNKIFYTVNMVIIICVFSLGLNIYNNIKLKDNLIDELNKKIENQRWNEDNIEIISNSIYPELYVDKPKPLNIYDEKTVYLTFDDGPSKKTLDILDILDSHGIKGTFFVTVQNEKDYTKEIMKEIVDRGHAIGTHTYSHDYRQIYKSVENYLEDFYKIYNYIYEATGVKSEIFRFPGGSVNAYNRTTYKDIISEMISRGFTYFDWNVSSDDSISNLTSKQIYQNSVKNMGKLDRMIVLYHDSADRKTTVEALNDVIKTYKEYGYKFDVLTRDIKPIMMNYK
ncbi:MAG: polysaccharide deacetylase family protein [Oscillospiraceae bacterium]